jgi:anti-anti-sigma factor
MKSNELLEVSDKEGLVVASFRVKNCLDRAALAELGTECGPLAGGSKLTVLLDFSRIENLGSGSLKFILRLHRILKKRGGGLTLCGLPPALAEVFRITKLDQLLSVKESVEAARLGLTARQGEPLASCPLCTWPQMGQCMVCERTFCEEHGSPRRRLCLKHRWISWIPFIVFVVVLVFLWLMGRN